MPFTKCCFTMSVAVFLSITLNVSAIAYYPVGGVLFLTVPPSTVADGMGQTHSPLNLNDSFQDYFFPGSSSGKQKTIAFGFMRDQLSQLGLSDISYNAAGFHGGRKFECCGDTSSLLTLGIYNINLILGDRAWIDEEGNSLGVIRNWVEGVVALRSGWKWNKGWNRRRLSHLTINAGLGFDIIRSSLYTGVTCGETDPTGWNIGLDWGLGAVARIYSSDSDRFNWDAGLQIAENFINRNGTFFADRAQAVPLPRQVHWSMASAVEWHRQSLPLARIHLAAGRTVSLLDDDEEYKPVFSSLFDSGRSSLGLEFTGAGTLTLRCGIHVDGPADLDMATLGWGLQSGCVTDYITLLNGYQPGRFVTFLNKFNLFYNYSAGARGNYTRAETVNHELGISLGY
jgi:hypothetical protein